MNGLRNAFGIMLMLFFLSITVNTYADKFGTTNNPPPQYVLIELPTHAKSIAYFIAHGNTYKAAKWVRERDTIIKNIVGDFNKYFDFCPHYYFMDTVGEEIEKGNFAGNLFDYNLHPVIINELPSNIDTTHFIVCWGAKVINDYIWPTRKPDPQNTDMTYGPRYMLLALDYKFRQLPTSFPYTNYPYLLVNEQILDEEYNLFRYKNKRSELFYHPDAFKYSETLYRFYKKPRYKVKVLHD